MPIELFKQIARSSLKVIPFITAFFNNIIGQLQCKVPYVNAGKASCYNCFVLLQLQPPATFLEAAHNYTDSATSLVPLPFHCYVSRIFLDRSCKPK